jgi:hypothetical protein
MRTLIALVLAGAAYAGGGFWLTLHSAQSPLGKQIPDVAVLVAAEGCGSPAEVKLTGTAEGVVNGERRSVTLEIVPTSKQGVWAVKKNLLGEGRWVLAIRAGLSGHNIGTVVELGPNGEYRAGQSFSAQELPKRVEAALKGKAG